MTRTDRQLPALGWREWVGFPDHGIDWVKAKVDTGARTSSLHAFGLHRFDVEGAPWVGFEIHPWQRSTGDAVAVELPVHDERMVRPSTGEPQLRTVVKMPVRIAGSVQTVELTLTRRDTMGFRMLLGRQALRNRYVVDSGRSYLGGRPPKSTRVANLAADDEDHDEGVP